jgi:hypothetical protein
MIPYLEKRTSQKKGGEVAQNVGLEFKPHYQTHTKNLQNITKLLV